MGRYLFNDKFRAYVDNRDFTEYKLWREWNKFFTMKIEKNLGQLVR